MAGDLTTTIDPDRLAPDAANPAVRDVMRDEVVFCLPSTPADAVAKLLADNHLTEMVVLMDRRPVGYVKANDVADLVAKGQLVIAGSDFAVRPPTTAVLAGDLMHQRPLLVDEGQRLAEVVSVMKQHGHELALVMHEDETPVGMITAAEVADHLLVHHG
jgi:CBS domain-containing protein